MATITYTAKRNLMDGHEAGEEYALQVAIDRWELDRSREGESETSLSGRQFYTHHRTDSAYSVGLLPLDKLGGVDPDHLQVVRQLREWEDSVEAGETFQIDPFGTPESPDEPITVTLQGDVSESQDGTVGYYRYSFTVRKFV